MDKRRAYPWEDQWVRQQVTQPDRFTGEGTFTLMPGGLAKWEATPQPTHAKPPAPAPLPRATQRAPVSKEEAMRIFKHSSAREVSTAAHAVAEHALRHALALHGLQPSQIELQWIKRLAPGASVMYDGEFHGPTTMTGKTLSDGHDGRTVTIFLRHDVPLELIAETVLHEAYHAVQFLYAPLAMRNDTLKAQIEQQAEAFAARHLRDLKGLMASFQRRRS